MSGSASPTVRRLFRLTLLCAALGFGLKAVVLAPLYVRLASDIAYSSAWWVDILYHLTDGGLMDLAVFAVCYPATLYAVRREGFKKAIGIPILFSVLTFLKFGVNFLTNAITDGALPDMGEFLSFDLPMILTMFFLEWLQYALVVLISLLVGRHTPPSSDFPFVRMYARKNVLQRGALLISLTVTLGRVVMHFIYQLALFANFGSSDGWIVMLIDLAGDISVGIICYFVSLLLMMRFYQTEQKKG